MKTQNQIRNVIRTWVLALTLGCLATAHGDNEVDPAILKAIDVAPAWSVHRIGSPELLTRDGYQYVGFYDDDRFLTLAQRELGTDQWTFKKFPVQMGWATGGHARLSIALDRDGYIHFTSYRRGLLQGPPSPPHAIYYRSEAPHSMEAFERLPMVPQNVNPQYPTFYEGGDDLFFRFRAGGSGSGDWLLNRYDPDQREWQQVLATPLIDGESTRGSYPVGPIPGPDGRFHVLWVWRDTPDHATNHTLSYARSTGSDLSQWETAGGVPVSTPFTYAQHQVVVDPTPPGGGLSNVFREMAWDSKGRLVISFHKFDDDGFSQIYNTRFIHGAWQTVVATRWDFIWGDAYSGTGAIGPFDHIQMSRVEPIGNGELSQLVWNREDGATTVILDEETLEPIRWEEPEPDPAWLQSIRQPESDFQVPPNSNLRRDGGPMQVHIIADRDGSDVENANYYLRWEHAGTNRDQAVPEPWPDPVMLRVYKIIVSPALELAHTNGETVVTEGGDSDTYTVVLNRAPEGDVIVSLSVDDQVTVEPTSLTFTASDWDVPQEVTVTAVDDDIHELIHTGTITHTTSSSDPMWDGLSEEFVVTVIDNDNTPPEVDAGPNLTLSLVGGVPWTPADIAPTAWYDASDSNSLTLVDGKVSQWNDKSTNGYTLVQGTAAHRPSSGIRTINGLHAVDFDGTASFMSITSGFQPGAGNSMIFAVVARDAASGDQRVFGGQVGTGTRFGLMFHTSSGANLDFFHSAGYAPTSLAAGTGEQLLSGYKNGTATGVGLNGAYTTASNGGTPSTLDKWYVGCYNGASAYLDGAIGEIVILLHYDIETRQKIEGYLAHKWGLQANLPADHPFKAAAPINAIATATLDGSASDADGDPLVTAWSVVSGPGPVSFGDSSAVETTASFNVPGTYVLSLTAFDGQDTTYDEVTITVTDGDVVEPTYNDWIAGFDLGERTGFGEDYNNDGVPNGLKYFFGIDPREPSPALSVLAPDVSDASRFSFTHPMAEHLPADIHGEYRWTKDLANFHADGASDADGTTVTFARGEPAEGMVTVTATIDGTPTDRIFVVLVVTPSG